MKQPNQRLTLVMRLTTRAANYEATQRLTLVMRLTTRAANYEATQSETDTGDETYYTCREVDHDCDHND